MAPGQWWERFFRGLLLMAVLNGSARGHDLWLMATSVEATPPTTLSFSIHVGHPFPVGKGSAEASRIATCFALTSEGRVPVTTFTAGFRYLTGKIPVENPGEYLVCLVTLPRFIELRPALFNEYLLREGLPHIHDRRQREGTMGNPGREIYSRSVKTLVRAGSPVQGVFQQAAGLDFEIVPRTDPLQLRPGAELPVILLFHGEPLSDYPIQAGHEGFATEGFAQEARTDPTGHAVFKIDQAGTWYIRSLHMEPAEGQEADWRSWWTSLTFKIPPSGN